MQVIYCPKEVQLICLSATVANPDELAGWIGQVSGNLKNLNISVPFLRICLKMFNYFIGMVLCHKLVQCTRM